MGAWKGIYMGLQAVKADKEAKEAKALEAEKLEMMREEFTEGKRKTRLDALIAFRNSRADDPTRKAMRTTLKNLKTMGLPKDVSAYLASSGEGDQIFEVWKSRRGKDLSDAWIPSLVERVKLELGDKDSPAAKAMAVKIALSSDEDQNTSEGQYAVLAESLFEINSREGFANFDETFTRIVMKPREPTISLPTIGDLTRGSAAVGPTMTSQIQKAVAERLSPTFGNIFIRDDQGVPIIDPKKSGPGVIKIRELFDETISNIGRDLQGVGSLSFDDALNKHIAIAKQTEIDLTPPSLPSPVETSDTAIPFTGTEPGSLALPIPENDNNVDPYGKVIEERR